MVPKSWSRPGMVLFFVLLVLAGTGPAVAAGPIGVGRIMQSIPGNPALVTSALTCPKGVSPLKGSCVLIGTQLSGFVTSGGEWMITKAVPGGLQSLSGNGVTLYPAGVSCPTATTCVVAGGLHTGVPVLAWFTNGALTKTAPIPGSSKVVLTAISCPNPNLCVAVGHAPVGTSGSVTQGVVVTARGAVVGAPRRVVGTTLLNAVACGSSSSCLAVGVGGNFTLINGQPEFNAAEIATYGKIGAIVQVINGAPAPAKTLAKLTTLTAVSCGTPGSCTALGKNLSGSVGLAVHGGTAGPAQPLPPADTGADISCLSASLCVAVGSAQATTSRPNGLVFLVDNGAVTSTATLPVPAALYHISCPVAGYCLAEGAFGPFPGAAGTVIVTP